MQTFQFALGRRTAQTGQAHDLVQVETLIDTYKEQAQQFLLGGREEGLSDHEPDLSMNELIAGRRIDGFWLPVDDRFPREGMREQEGRSELGWHRSTPLRVLVLLTRRS